MDKGLSNYIRGLSLLLNDYLPSIFPIDALSVTKSTVSSTGYNDVKWTLKFFISGVQVEKEITDGLAILPENGVIKPFSKHLITPLMLIENRKRFLDKARKTMDLKDFWIIRGAFLAKAFFVMQHMMDTFFKRSDKLKLSGHDKRKPVYEPIYTERDRIFEIADSELFDMLLTSKLNHTFRGTEQFPLFVETPSENNSQNPVVLLRYIKCHGYLPYLVKNKLHGESEKRKVVYHGEKVSNKLRLPHPSHLGALDMLESPESEMIGLTLFMARGGEYIPETLAVEKPKQALSNHPEEFLSYSTGCVPFLNYSDGPRISMGGKNLKQAINVNGSEPPLIKTGNEEAAGIHFGVNALVGYMLYQGKNFEDGIVISESFARKMASEKPDILKTNQPTPVYNFGEIQTEKNGDHELLYSEFRKEGYQYRVCYEFKCKGTASYKEPLLTYFVKRTKILESGRGKVPVYSDKWEKVPLSNGKKEKRLLVNNSLYPITIKKCEVSETKVYDYRYETIAYDLKKKVQMELKDFSFRIVETKPFEIGDKLTGRHGNKGTVSAIIRDEEMPKVEIGGELKTLECLISPMSVVSRMNLGQLLEIHASAAYGNKTVTPFEKIDQQQLLTRLKEKGADDWGYFKLESGKRIAAGWQYMVRLDHCIRNKLHVQKTAVTSTLSGQPVKGKKNGGGQRIGEMEFWTLFSHNALNTIEDFAKTNIPENSEQYKAYQKQNKQILETLLTMVLEKHKNSDEYTKYIEYISNHDTIPFKDFQKRLNQQGDRKMNAGTGKYYSLDIKEKVDGNRLTTGFSLKQKADKTLPEEIKDFKRENRKRAMELVHGKDGFFRKHMLGRRVHYSGRTAISPVPGLDIEQVYLPVDAGLEWFGNRLGLKLSPSDFNNFKHGDYAKRKEIAKKLNEYENKTNYLVLLNRQPSLHRHSIQAFYPLFWEHYSIGLPTLVCEGFGADFDGDTMAFYFPVSQFTDDDDLREEVRQELEKMLPTNNPFRLGDRELAWSSSQDFAFGQYERDGTGKKGFEKGLRELVERKGANATDEIQDYKRNILDRSTAGELSTSFFDITENPDSDKKGPFLIKFKESKARGKDQQFQQLSKEIEILKSGRNFGRGLDPEDYLCTKENDSIENKKHPIALRSRDNLMTKKLSVAKAGYFTRKMVSFLYSYRITEDDCRANSGFVLSRAFFDELNEEDPSTFPLDRFILGRYIKTNGKWELIDEKRLEKIKKDSTWQQLEIRSPLTCQTKTGVCKKCYGADIARPGIAEEALPQKGEFVGLSAGHVIGEFGTQFSMKAFQTGADFSTDRLSSVFFERQKTYPEYLKHIHKAKEDESLFKTIEVFSIHMELLYRYMTLNDVYSENDMKEKLKDWKNHGLLSALSFEGTKGILKDDVLQAVLNLQESISEIQLEEKSPSVYYMFSNPHIKELLTNG